VLSLLCCDSRNAQNGTLNAHNGTLNAHNGTLNAHNDTLNAHNDTLNAHNDTLNAHNDTLVRRTGFAATAAERLNADKNGGYAYGNAVIPAVSINNLVFFVACTCVERLSVRSVQRKKKKKNTLPLTSSDTRVSINNLVFFPVSLFVFLSFFPFERLTFFPYLSYPFPFLSFHFHFPYSHLTR
jgi:hypothetical protein